MVGGNFRLHEIQAAFLRVKLRHLHGALQNRRIAAARLVEELQSKWRAVFPVDRCVCEGERQSLARTTPGTVLLPYACQEGVGEHTWNQFVIRITGPGKRDETREILAQDGIQTEVYYPRAMHQQSCFAKRKVGEFLSAETFCKETLALPLQCQLPSQR